MEEKERKGNTFQHRFMFVRSWFLRLGYLAKALVTIKPGDVRILIRSFDHYLAQKQIQPEKISSEQERKLLGYIAILIIELIFLGFAAYISLSILISIFWRGPMPVMRTAQLPAVQVSPTARPVVDVWAQYDKLTQVESRELRTKRNVLNIVILDGGGAIYLRDYAARFDPIKPGVWHKNDQPFGLSNMSVEGTAVYVQADKQDYVLNVYQGFTRSKDSTILYVVDHLGHIWESNVADLDSVLIPIGQVHPPVEVSPNPGLSFTF